jgi:uncharacterized protein (UPF0335 family)
MSDYKELKQAIFRHTLSTSTEAKQLSELLHQNEQLEQDNKEMLDEIRDVAEKLSISAYYPHTAERLYQLIARMERKE